MPQFKWSHYGFRISRNSQLGIYVLLLILVVLVLINLCLPQFVTANSAAIKDKQLDLAWQQYLSQNEYSLQTRATDTQKNTFADTIFAFNPNEISKHDLLRLGLPDRTVYTWLHYREKGGHFYKKEDLKKLYTLSEKDYLRLVPYVVLPEETYFKQQKYEKDAPQHFPSNKAIRRPKKDIHLALNQADTTSLKRLSGIGSVYAARIIKFRDRLGGFYSVHQLREVYGLPDSTFNKIAKHLYVDPATVQKININKADYQKMAHHPYLRPYVKAILKLRKQLGKFTSVEQLKQISLINEQNYRKIAAYLTI